MFTPDSTYLVSSSYDSTFRVWDIENAAECYQSRDEGAVRGLSLSKPMIATHSYHAVVKIFYFKT